MAHIAVDMDGTEGIFRYCPHRVDGRWTDCRSEYDENYFSVEDCNSRIVLPRGTILRLTGDVMDWKDNPKELCLDGMLY